MVSLKERTRHCTLLAGLLGLVEPQPQRFFVFLTLGVQLVELAKVGREVEGLVADGARPSPVLYTQD